MGDLYDAFGTGVWLPKQADIQHIPLGGSLQTNYEKLRTDLLVEFSLADVTVMCGHESALVVGSPVGPSTIDPYSDLHPKRYDTCRIYTKDALQDEVISIGRDIPLASVVAIKGDVSPPDVERKGYAHVTVGTVVFSATPLPPATTEELNLQVALGHVKPADMNTSHTSLCEITVYNRKMAAHAVTVGGVPAYYLPPVTDHLSIVGADTAGLDDKVVYTTEESFRNSTSYTFGSEFLKLIEEGEREDYGSMRKLAPVIGNSSLHYVTDMDGVKTTDNGGNPFYEGKSGSLTGKRETVIHRLVASPNTVAQANLFYKHGIVPGNIYDGVVITENTFTVALNNMLANHNPVWYVFLKAGVMFKLPREAEGDVIYVCVSSHSDEDQRKRTRNDCYRFLDPRTMRPSAGWQGKVEFQKSTPRPYQGWYIVNALARHTGLANFKSDDAIAPANVAVGDIVYVNEISHTSVKVTAFFCGNRLFKDADATFELVDPNGLPFLGTMVNPTVDTDLINSEKWQNAMKTAISKFEVSTTLSQFGTEETKPYAVFSDNIADNDVEGVFGSNYYTGDEIEVQPTENYKSVECRYDNLAKRVIARARQHVQSTTFDIPDHVIYAVYDPVKLTFDATPRANMVGRYGDMYAGAEAVLRAIAFSGVNLDVSVIKSHYKTERINPLYQILSMEGDNVGMTPNFALLMMMGPARIEMFLQRGIANVKWLGEEWDYASNEMDVRLTALQRWHNFSPHDLACALSFHGDAIIENMYANVVDVHSNARRASATASEYAALLSDRLRAKRYVDMATAMLAVKFAYYERSARRLQTDKVPHVSDAPVFALLAEAARVYNFYALVVQMPPPPGRNVENEHRLLPADPDPYIKTGTDTPARTIQGAELVAYTHIEKGFHFRPETNSILEMPHNFNAFARLVAYGTDFRVIKGPELTYKNMRCAEGVTKKSGKWEGKIIGKKVYPKSTYATTIMKDSAILQTLVGRDTSICVDGGLNRAFIPRFKGRDPQVIRKVMGLACQVFDAAADDNFSGTSYTGDAPPYRIEYTTRTGKWIFTEAKDQYKWESDYHFFRAVTTMKVKVDSETLNYDLSVGMQLRGELGEAANFTNEELVLVYAAIEHPDEMVTVTRFASGAPIEAGVVKALLQGDTVTISRGKIKKKIQIPSLASNVLTRAEFK